MKRLSEGNLYNIEQEISSSPAPSISGLEKWKKEVKKELIKKLKNKQIKNLDQIISKTFGTTLE